MPFLENVTRGRGVPRERLEEVAQHYHHFGGASPINALNRDMIAALQADLSMRGEDLPIYFGNRNWDPYAADALEQCYRDGHRRILVFTTSAWGGYSGCKQYHEDIAGAIAALREREPASNDDPVLLRKLPQYWSQAAFLDAQAGAVRRAVAALPDPDGDVRSSSPPTPSRCGPTRRSATLYSRQVAQASAEVAARLVADGIVAGSAVGVDYDQVWQSRSGRRRCRGSNPTSPITCGHWRPADWARSSSRPSDSSPTTSKWCGTSTTNLPNWRVNWAWDTPGPTPSEPTRASPR